MLSLAGVLGGGWLIGRWAFGLAVIADSVAVGVWALLRDDGAGGGAPAGARGPDAGAGPREGQAGVVTRLVDRLLRRDGGYWEGMATGAAVLTSSYASPDREPVLPQLASYAQGANASSAPVFAAALVRTALFSEARFQYQALDDGHLFGNTSLSKLEEPFGPGTTTGHLLAPDGAGRVPGGERVHRGIRRMRTAWSGCGRTGPRSCPRSCSVNGGGWYRKPVGLLVRAAQLAAGPR